MRFFCRRLLGGGAAALALVVLSAATAPIASANQAGPKHSGHAYAIGLEGIKVLNTVSVADTFLPEVYLPSGGGTKDAELVDVNLPPGNDPIGLVHAEVAKAAVEGHDSESNAKSSVTSVSVLPFNVLSSHPTRLPAQLSTHMLTDAALLQAKLLTSRAAVNCSGGVQLGSSIADLTVLGTKIPIDAPPNTEIDVPLGTEVAARVKVNVQVKHAAGGTVWGSASAVVVEFPDDGPLAEVLKGTVILSHAEADMHGCPAAQTSPTPTPTPTSGGGSGKQPGFPVTGAQ
jgi:hypothetical protein